MDFIFYHEHHRIFISNLIMSNILAEKGRLNNMFPAYAMNIYELLLTCLWKIDRTGEYVLEWCGVDDAN